ncbi:MAG: dihydroorotase [Clostridia bacterium]|nr:dihydroorotase [Clostridia bacterium]
MISGKKIWNGSALEQGSFSIENGMIKETIGGKTDVFFDGLAVFPGFADVHVHFREPGFSYKETIGTGSMAAAKGGYTTVCTMPNLNPVPDSREHLRLQLDAIAKDACIRVIPFGSITVGQAGEEMADLEAMAEDTAGFSDDGKGVQDPAMMKDAMLRAKAMGKMISAHCEVNDLLFGGYIHDGEYARTHGHRGICSESEWKMIERDIALAEETGCAYHVCHISTKESVALIRDAKNRGVNITCETGPHYLTMCDSQLQEDGRFKMNPPIRSAEDRDALVAGLLDGTIGCIATDHAPHSAEEKGRGLEKSAMGVVGLETAFPVLYRNLVLPGIVPLKTVIDALTVTPLTRFGLGSGRLTAGERADFTVWDLDAVYTVDPETFATMGRATPFAGDTVQGRCMMTVCGGRAVYVHEEMTKQYGIKEGDIL